MTNIYSFKKELLYVILLLLAFSVIPLKAGTTGKISGKVTDAETGEPLPGINIILKGTTMGAATDEEGRYVIINVPPETYTVVVSGVGFRKKIFENVKVSADFTTRLNVEMSSESVEVEEVVIQAKEPLVRKDLTSSQASIDAKEIESLPVESISQVLTLQAGVVQGSGGAIHIRGGRSNEIAYTVNGVSISNPFNNSRSVNIATNAVKELSVISGTFNAEYGNALSGIVNTVTKEGSRNYNGTVSFYTGDYISSRTGVFMNIDDFDPINTTTTEMTFGGPVPMLENKLSFFISGRWNESKGYLYGIRQHTIYDSVYKNPSDPNDIRISSTGDGEVVSMNPSTSISATAKLTYKPFSGLKINYDAIYSNGEAQYYNHDLKYNPDANYNNYNWGLMNSLEVRQAVSNSTFYTLRGFFNMDDTKQYLFPLRDSNGNKVNYYPYKYSDSEFNNLQPDPRYQPEHKTVTAANYTFLAGGTLNNHYYQRSKTYGGKFDITSQMDKSHEVKLGIEYKNHTLDYENFDIKRDTVRYLEPTILPFSTPEHDRYSKNPIVFSGYIQDKMEFDDLILNVGVRYDYFEANSKYSTNIFYPSPNYPDIPPSVDKSSLTEEASPKHQISPRLGVSFPITDRGIIHFSYGHFFQMPPFQYLYSNPTFEYSYAVGTPLFGNADLNPERTVTYELGLQQQLTENLAFNVTSYFKDVRDLLALQQIRISGDQTYLKYVNKDYGNIKGITFSLTKRRTTDNYFGFTLDYTFQVAEGNENNSDSFFLDLASGRQSEKIPVYLDWDQTHTLNTTVSVGRPNDWSVAVVGRLGSGLPYTPEVVQKQVFLRENMGRKPEKIQVDLMSEKSISFQGLNFTVFLRVYNLFDNLNERFVYSSTGRATYTLDALRGSAQATNDLASKVPEVKSANEYFDRPNYYDPPREVKLGLTFEF